MSLTVKDIAALTAYLTALRYVPQDLQFPKHYLISKIANSELSKNRVVIEATPNEPTGWSDIAWPIKKIVGEAIRGFDYAVERPLFAIGLLVEKTIRGDFDSSVSMAENNLAVLRKQNITYDEELKKLAPIADLVLRIVEAAKQETDALALQNLQTEEGIALRNKQIENISEALQKIDLEIATQAIEKITAAAQKALSSPHLVRNLKTNTTRLEKAEKDLQDAKESLIRARDTLEQKTSCLEELMQRAETLSLEQDAVFKKLKSQGEALLEKSKLSQQPLQPSLSNGSSTQPIY